MNRDRSDTDARIRKVPYVDLKGQYAAEAPALLAAVETALSHGQWVGGPEIERFEARIAAYCGAPHAIAVASGTDALILALRALGIGPGHEVITAPNSFIATASAIVQVGARPVFVDVGDDQNLDPGQIEAAITPRTRALLPVHLTGRMADMRAVLEIARRHDLRVIEDAAQAIGSKLHQQSAGTWGDIGCFSAHPLKNLNATGDAGYLLTADDRMANRLRSLRNNGLVDRDTALEWGVVSRMDSVQAAILCERLEKLDSVIQKRRRHAERYRRWFAGTAIYNPPCRAHEFNTFHTFVVQVERRDELRQYLETRGVGTATHYRVPIHLQPAAALLGYKPGDFPRAELQAQRIVSLPVHQGLDDDDIDYVSQLLLGWCR